MKKAVLAIGFVALLCTAGLVVAEKAKTPASKAPAAPAMTQAQKVGYSVGWNVGQSLKGNGVAIDTEALLAGIRAGLSGEEAKFGRKEIDNAFASYRGAVQTHKQTQAKAQGQANGKAGAAFLAANGKKVGVRVTASGLQYKVLRPGKGRKPQATDKVTVHYRGTLIDGREFDSSYKRGKPISFGLNRVIKGWSEGVQLMQEGARYQFVIPPAIGYGERGAGRLIGPNATLIFEVELVKIEDAAE